ncbi:MAG: cation:proton antiporter [Gemmatimonadales bacterium]
MTFLALFVAIVFLYSLVSERVERVATAPVVFTMAGLLLPVVVPEFNASGFELTRFLWVAEAGLVLLLFTDATRTDLSLLRKIRDLPARLLGPGLLLTIALGAVVAVFIFPNLSIWEACLVAVILAPTDAGLGQVVVESPRVPARIRQALNVEAGLNDGLSVPFLLFFLAMLEAGGGSTDATLTRFIGLQLGLGALLGLGIGLGGGWLLQRASRAGSLTESFAPRGLIALPFFCFVGAERLQASMFIAAFVAGLAAQRMFPGAGKHAVDFSEQSGQVLNLAVFFLFGLAIGRSLDLLSPIYFLYGILSLTVIRMLPVAVALLGARLQRATVVFMGWFGPRGLASIVLGLLVVERELGTPGDPTIRGVVVATILMSIVLHGVSAQPGIAWYAGKVRAFPPGVPELAE